MKAQERAATLARKKGSQRFIFAGQFLPVNFCWSIFASYLLAGGTCPPRAIAGINILQGSIYYRGGVDTEVYIPF